MMIQNATDAKNFILAGRATVTLKSVKTGNRFTYKIKKGEGENAPHFVSLLTGPDNENSYRYMAAIFNNKDLRWSKKSCVSENAASFAAFRYVFQRVLSDVQPDGVEIYHDGRCGACRRKLTVPESILSGLGPICAKRDN